MLGLCTCRFLCLKEFPLVAILQLIPIYLQDSSHLFPEASQAPCSAGFPLAILELPSSPQGKQLWFKGEAHSEFATLLPSLPVPDHVPGPGTQAIFAPMTQVYFLDFIKPDSIGLLPGSIVRDVNRRPRILNEKLVFHVNLSR